MIASFFDSFAFFVKEATPYVITWHIGIWIVNALISAVTGRGIQF